MTIHTVLCTVGTSLLKYAAEPSQPRLDPRDSRCGAEINSLAGMADLGSLQLAPDYRVVLLHSDTDDGLRVARLIQGYLGERHEVVLDRVEGLQDEDPGRFARAGLRNLVRRLCHHLRAFGRESCAINATGGYKAQIAVAVILGQALGLPVYYKHERFPSIIAFPPLPISLDQALWMEWSGLFYALARKEYGEIDSWPEKTWPPALDSLIDREDELMQLSAAGMVFHESMLERFPELVRVSLPGPAPRQRPPKIDSDHAWKGRDQELRAYLERVTKLAPYITATKSSFYSPNLSLLAGFRLTRGEIEGSYGKGNWTAKFQVHTTAETLEEKRACIADLNRIASELN